MLELYFRKPFDCIIPVDCEMHILSVPYVLTGLAVNAVVHQLKKLTKIHAQAVGEF